MSDIQTMYLRHVFNPDLFQKAVDKTITVAEEFHKKVGFDTIAFSGMSGSAMAFILSHWMNMPLLCVRKRGENSHYVQERGSLLEGNVRNAKKYLIVDDFVSSGATVLHIVNTINQGNEEAKCIGLLMYAAYEDNTFSNRGLNYTLPIISSRPRD